MSDHEEVALENGDAEPLVNHGLAGAGHAAPAIAAGDALGAVGGVNLNAIAPTFQVRPPDPLKLGKDAATNWKLWKQMWTHYCVVTGTTEQTRGREYLTSLFISTLGIEALQIYNGCDPVDTDSVEEITKKLDGHILGELNETFERYKFNTRAQKSDESIDSYIAALKTLAKTCNFCVCLKDTLLRDRIVLGVKDDTTRKRLLQDRKLTLAKCLDICRSYENTTSQLKVISGSGEQVHKVVKSHKTRGNKAKQYKAPSVQTREYRKPAAKSANITCKFCAKQHQRNRELCPAWGKTCIQCGEENHYKKCCPRRTRHVHGVDEQYSESDSDYIFMIDTDRKRSGPIYTEMLLESGQKAKFQIDCGATVNVIPRRLVKHRKLEPTNTRLSMYNKSTLKPVGKCQVKLRNPVNKMTYNVEFQVVDDNLIPLISGKAAEEMCLITINYENFKQLHAVTTTDVEKLVSEYGEVFDQTELGQLPGEVHLYTEKGSKPKQLPARRVPIAVKSKLKDELSTLVDQGVITSVTEPTDWCSQMSVQTKKSGKLRICIDPRPLNEVLQRERYPLQTMEDILPELSKAKVFSKVDLAQGYHHCVLDEESSYLTTFITPFGRYRWIRLPFGTKVSSEIFQRKLMESLEGLEGVACIADDILVYGISDEDHGVKLKNLLQRCQQKHIKLNKEKSVFQTNEVEFMGHRISSEGLKPDEKKVEAILKMEKPTDTEGARRLQGTVNYLAKFLPKLSTVMEPIRRLTHQDVKWEWTEEHDRALEEIKTLATSAPVLAYYEPNKNLVIQCDASSTGLGAALLQDGHPLAYASRALTDTECGYAQIEKECLAIVFALERFHQYTFGRKTIVLSDHKPLESIVRKPLHKAPKRIQGMLLRLLQYDTEVEYTKGKEMYIADTLSRAYLKDSDESSDQFSQVNAVGHLRINPASLQDLRDATHKDEDMVTLKSIILQGWPENKQDVPSQTTPYFAFRDELSVHDGLIFKGERIVVPKSMRSKMKERLHNSHLGSESMLRRARECVYWPGMTAEIKQITESCDTCQTFGRAQQRETLEPIEVNYPWEVVGTDLFVWHNKDYLLTIDYFSGFWEVDRLQTTSANAVIKCMKQHFSRYGIPSKVVSDNGPQYSGQEFAEFAKTWEFEHCTSAPGHPNANGKAESGVKAAKIMMDKSAKSKTDPFIALMEIRNTPTQGTDSSPSQRLMNRRTRTLIPMTQKLLAPRGGRYLKQDRSRIRHKQQRQKSCYDKSAKDLPVLGEGDTVRMKPFRLGQKEWKKAVVNRRLDDRSYEVETPEGTYRRNRVHLRKTGETSPDTGPETSNVMDSMAEETVGRENPIVIETNNTPKGSTTPRKSRIPVFADKPASPSPPPVRRSGRVTRQPEHFKDFVVTK